MKFAEIIREAGVKPSSVPKAAELPIVLYDEKKRKIAEETIHFAKPIFEKNFNARMDFLRFVVELERQLKFNWDLNKSHVLRVQITEDLLLVGFGATCPVLFPRLPQQP